MVCPKGKVSEVGRSWIMGPLGQFFGSIEWLFNFFLWARSITKEHRFGPDRPIPTRVTKAIGHKLDHDLLTGEAGQIEQIAFPGGGLLSGAPDAYTIHIDTKSAKVVAFH